MAYNTGFPATYPQAGYQVPGYAQTGFAQQPGMYTQPQAGNQSGANYGPQTAMTPPTIHAEIIQVDSEAAVDTQPQAAGTAQMYMTRDDQCIIIKTQYAGGNFDKACYDRRPPAPAPEPFDPSEYVRRDELPSLIAQAVAGQNSPKKVSKKEAIEE